MKIGMPKDGRFGDFGGKYIPETLVPAIEELEEKYQKIKSDKSFQNELEYYLKNYAGRPTPLYFAENLTKSVGGAKIYLKREDLLHGGAHKNNNTLGQALLAKKIFFNLNEKGFIHDLELVVLCNNQKITIKELPIKWTHIPNSKLNLFKDSIKMFIGIFRLKIKFKI